MKRFLIPLSVVPLLLILAYGFTRDPRAIPSPLVGRPAPPFRLTSFAGEPVDGTALRDRVVVVNFWASWCYPACYEEAPLLEAAWQTYKDRGVVFLGVDIQDREEPAREFLRRFKFTFPNAPDPTGKVSIDFGVYGVPETFFIGKGGQIRYKHVGALTPEVMKEWIERLLQES